MLEQYLLSLHEGTIISDNTISVNLQDFESGKKNKLLIIGLMGSGKTTWAEFLSKNKSTMVNGRYPARKSRVKWRSIDSMYYRLDNFPATMDRKKKKDLLGKKVLDGVIKLLKSKERWIIEGINLIDIYRDNSQYKKLILNQPMILIGMSALRAGIRGGIRNMSRDGGGESWRELYWMPKINIKSIEPSFKQLRKDALKIKNVDIKKYKIESLR